MDNMFICYIANKSKQNKYLHWYLSIVKNGLNRNDLNENCEMHHIVPVSFKKEWKKEPSNIVKLTYREHFIAHRCLTKMFEGIYLQKMIYALGLLYSKQSEKRTKSSRVYEQLRKHYSTYNTMKNSEAKKKISVALTGRNKETHSYIEQAAEKKSKTMRDPNSTFQLKNRVNYRIWIESLSDEDRKKIFGRVISKEFKQKLSVKRKGQTANNCERVKKMQTTKLKRFASMTLEERKKTQGHSLGMSWYHNDCLNQSKTFFPNNVPAGWIKGRKFYEKN
jgi:hypothetical protein